MHEPAFARVIPAAPAGSPPRPHSLAPRAASPITGGELLALVMGLRARGLRGLDVLRRSQDRAPPTLG